MNPLSLDEKIAAKRAGRLVTTPISWQGILKRSWSPSRWLLMQKQQRRKLLGGNKAGISHSP